MTETKSRTTSPETEGSVLQDYPSLSEQETAATLRALIFVAKADGRLEDREREALKASLAGISLPTNTTFEGLLQESIDLDAQLSQVTSSDAGERLLQSAVAVACSGGVRADQLNPVTRQALERIRERFKIGEDREQFFERLWSETKDTVLLSSIEPIADPERRAAAVDKDVLKYSTMSAVLGSFPVPGLAIATDLGVVALQVKLVRDIGQYWGHKVDRTAATSLLGGLGVGTGMRIAVSNLAKLVPGWGSMVGAAASFASTWALGKVARKYFESGMKADVATLRSDFRSAETEGRAAYSQQAPAIEAKKKETRERVQELNAGLQSGKLSRSEYEAKVTSLT